MSTTRFSFRSLSRGRVAFVITLSDVAAGVFWIWYRQPDPEALVARAYDAVQTGDFDSAQQALGELHQHDRSNAEVVEWLAEICLTAGDEADVQGARLSVTAGQRVMHFRSSTDSPQVLHLADDDAFP